MNRRTNALGLSLYELSYSSPLATHTLLHYKPPPSKQSTQEGDQARFRFQKESLSKTRQFTAILILYSPQVGLKGEELDPNTVVEILRPVRCSVGISIQMVRCRMFIADAIVKAEFCVIDATHRIAPDREPIPLETEF